MSNGTASTIISDRQVQAYFLGGKYPRAEESSRVYSAMNNLLNTGDTDTLAAVISAAGLPKYRVRVIVTLSLRAS